MMEKRLNSKQPKVKVRLEKNSVLPVVRGLLSLLLKANFSCHADMFLLAAKVLVTGNHYYTGDW